VDGLYLAYLAVTGLFVVTPGATTAVVVRNTLAGGHRAGLSAALGAAAANAFHAALAGLGLWSFVGRWPALLQGLRFASAAYLAWLGVRSLRRAWPNRKRTDAVAPGGSAPPSRLPQSGFVEGVTINLLNPAILSFYLAVVPTFMPMAPPPGYYTLLAASHVAMALACHSAWVYAFQALRRIVERSPVQRTLELLTAAAMWWLAWRVVAQL
jgi:threonine/homoserine/homoserine lactone efflux protein